jgi:hypothetical protein
MSYDQGVRYCVSQLSITITKYWRHLASNEKRFILVHNFGGFSPLLVGPSTFGPVVRQYIIAGST